MNICEAVIRVRGSWVRCGRPNAHLHHRLTRARGGEILDAVGETYHQMYLCARHHAVAHDQGSAFTNGLLLDGYVITGRNGPVYTGSDEYLARRYPAELRGELPLPDLSDPSGSPVPSQGLREEAS